VSFGSRLLSPEAACLLIAPGEAAKARVREMHTHGGACFYCCDLCNHDQHSCHFCGDPLRHDGLLLTGDPNPCHERASA
jgi:hypothetical protein